MKADYLNYFKEKPSFSRSELHDYMENIGITLSESNFKAKFQKLLEKGEIARAGRNAYYIPDIGTMHYSYKMSPKALKIAKILENKYPYVNFTIFELVQLNEFVNHQLAHTAFFVDVENDAVDFVFETLKELYPGKVLRRPTPDEYYTYWTDDIIVVQRLITETPFNRKCHFEVRLEKILVDLLSSKLLKSIISQSEYPRIYNDAFQKYIIDESTLFRYARRRNVLKKLLSFIKNKTEVNLRVMELC